MSRNPAGLVPDLPQQIFLRPAELPAAEVMTGEPHSHRPGEAAARGVVQLRQVLDEPALLSPAGAKNALKINQREPGFAPGPADEDVGEIKIAVTPAVAVKAPDLLRQVRHPATGLPPAHRLSVRGRAAGPEMHRLAGDSGQNNKAVEAEASGGYASPGEWLGHQNLMRCQLEAHAQLVLGSGPPMSGLQPASRAREDRLAAEPLEINRLSRALLLQVKPGPVTPFQARFGKRFAGRREKILRLVQARAGEGFQPVAADE